MERVNGVLIDELSFWDSGGVVSAVALGIDARERKTNHLTRLRGANIIAFENHTPNSNRDESLPQGSINIDRRLAFALIDFAF